VTSFHCIFIQYFEIDVKTRDAADGRRKELEEMMNAVFWDSLLCLLKTAIFMLQVGLLRRDG
jgi:hypothetical protein